MLCTTLLALTALLPTEVDSSTDARLAAATALRERLAELERHPACLHRFPLLLSAAQEAGATLGREAFGDELRELVQSERWRALSRPEEASARLEGGLVQALSDLEFEPLIEAALPEGFPAPTPVRDIELKQYPRYRLARAEMVGGRDTGAFMQLFRHIQKHDIPMTAPVEMTWEGEPDALREVDMAFMYEHPRQGLPGEDEGVEVVDVPAMQVVSLGCRGRGSDAEVEDARRRLLAWIEGRGDLEVAGELRQFGYNSPMVPRSRRYFEVQIPVRTMKQEREERVVIDFRERDEPARWSTVDDAVMGGVSVSRFARSEEGTGLFIGNLSLENNGGFSSVRTARSDLGLGDAEALTVRFRGDGKAYRFRLRTRDEFDVMSYQVTFETEPGVWMERRFRFEEFEPWWRGSRVPNAPELRPGEVRGLGFLIADKQEGSFRLELESIRASR